MKAGSEVYGVRETLAALRQLDSKLSLAVAAKMRGAAKPLVDEINAFVPSEPPLEGFAHNGRTGWGKAKKFRAKSGGRWRRGSNTWPLLEIRNDSAPVAIFDMAAAGQFGDALTRHWGAPSRAAYRARGELYDTTAGAVLEAVEDFARRYNVELSYAGKDF